ncbi:MAG: ACT domain-containing protein [Candidatus Eisenbacteria bacterium]|nr:ACT domain-containing protein [Candidatus Eisenbacteria bacterium]
MSARRALALHPERFAVCRFAPDDPLPAWVFHAGATTWSLTRTPRELSLVCPEDDLPPAIERAERGWRAFEVAGPIPFEETGVLAGLAAPLAAAGIPVFALSTHDTDLLFVRERDLERATAALAAAGHETSA